MKSNIKTAAIWLGLSILMMIFLIIGLMIGNVIFPSDLMEQPADPGGNGELLLLLTCAMNTAVILYFIYNSPCRGWKLAGALFLVIFGIQYFMSQIETLWFNDSLKMPLNTILAVVSGGAIMTLLFSLAATWFTGNFKRPKESACSKVTGAIGPMAIKIILLSVIIWPLIYFLAGYLIAWQFAEVRQYYSGTTEMDSFISMMKANFASGLYFFQILRGVLWVLIALLVFAATKGSWIRKGVILGLLLAFLGSSQLLLPNPIMPEAVRMGHLLETAPSSFVWGVVLGWVLR